MIKAPPPPQQRQQQQQQQLVLRRQLSQVPVTALDFLGCNDDGDDDYDNDDNYVDIDDDRDSVLVLAGEHARLMIYKCKISTLAASEPEPPLWSGVIFPAREGVADQPIHGVHAWHTSGSGGKTQALIWGGASIALVCLDGVNAGKEPRVLGVVKAPDRVYDVVASPVDQDCRAALVTAHNDVVVLEWRSGRLELGACAVASPERPMLYAARLAWLPESSVLVAAGTVFGDVIVWRCDVGAAADADTDAAAGGAGRALICRLKGHEGSVYGVDISPRIALPDGSTMRLVASCSDDRTIRVWNVSDAETAGAGFTPQASDAVEATGFRSASPNNATASDNGRLVAVAMGHLSRIWGVKLGIANPAVINEPVALADACLCVYSFGEDATAQRWRLSLHQARPGGGLTHERTMALHSGKHLWAGAVLCRPGLPTLVATGGGDGKICLAQDPVPLLTNPSSKVGGTVLGSDGVVTVDMHDIVVASLSNRETTRDSGGGGGGDGEAISRYDFVSADEILVSTTLGRLFLGSLGDGVTWKELDIDPDMIGELKLIYTIRAVGNGAAVLGTTSGCIIYFRRPSLVARVVDLPGKVADVNCLSAAAPGRVAADGSAVDIMVHLHGTSCSHRLILDAVTGNLLTREQTIGLDARFVATSAARMDDLLLMGSRHGWLSLLTRHQDAWRPTLDMAPRSRDAITSMVPLPPRSGSTEPSPYFVATSRDGKLRIWHVSRHDGGQVECQLLHETAPPLGPMIEGAWFTTSSSSSSSSSGKAPELILYGFRSQHFVVWNETRREEVGAVECGGAHRTFRPWFGDGDGDGNGSSAADIGGSLRLAFTRTSRLALSWRARPVVGTLKTGTHGREIRALSAGSGRYVASGAEDTTIRIWECLPPAEVGGDQEEVLMRHMATAKAHVTGIQQLRWHGDDYLFSSAGNEEFLVWRVRRLDSSLAGLAVLCEARLEDRSETGDLRIMDFDVSDDNADDEGGVMVITLALSNSMLRTYGYSASGGFQLLSYGTYTGACLTQVRHLGVCSRDELWVVTASTDGHLALWVSTTTARKDQVQVQDSDEDQARTQVQGQAQFQGKNQGWGREPGRRYVMKQACRVHQSSIKGLTLTKRGIDGGYVVITGGDDNALGVSIIRHADYNDEEERVSNGDGGGSGYVFERRGPVVMASAHAAAINGVVAWGCDSADDNSIDSTNSNSNSNSDSDRTDDGSVMAISVSNDQRVRTWRIHGASSPPPPPPPPPPRVELMGSAHSGVADAGAVAILRPGNILVGGVGVEIWSLGLGK